MTTQQAFALALEHHQAGRLGEAEALYRQILVVQPNHAEAVHRLGIIAHQVGRHDLAVEWIGRALTLHPNNPDAHSNLGNALKDQGQLDQAVAAYRRALQLKPDFAIAHNNLGNALKDRGQFDEAIAAYQRALHWNPDYALAYYNLGNILRERGQLDAAIAACRRALELQPDNPGAHNNLAGALTEQGHFDEAIFLYRRALQQKPDYALAYCNMGNALRKQGRLDEAVAVYRRALALQPDLPEACYSLANALKDQGQLHEAVAAYHRALELQPYRLDTHNNLGIALAGQGRLDEAIAAYRRALQVGPDDPGIHNSLGVALAEKGQLDEALAACRRALELLPNYPEAHNNLGNMLTNQGHLDEAIASYRRALQLKPEDAQACYNLGNALREGGHLDEPIAAYRRALLLQPDYLDAHINLGNALKDQGELDAAVAAYRRALELQPTCAWVHSNLVYALHFHPSRDHTMIAGEHRRWNRQFADPLKRFIQPHANDRSPGRRLRIGYVSPEFRDHVVGRNLVPLFACHDRGQYEILCYSGVLQLDSFTETFRRRADHWRNMVGVEDEALAEMIRQDGVDILVDLTQHVAGDRLPVFARQPAPVQVSFAGYPETTGLEAIGYRISDRYLEGDLQSNLKPQTSNIPPEQVCLIDSFWCYDPCGMAVEVNALPAQENGRVTFGCLNNFSKINDPALELWARVLRKVKDSQLVVLSPAGSHRQRILDVLRREGVEAHRVAFEPPCNRKAYLALYRRLDLILDPFPYGGHTTSLDALWMGVPVVSLVGERAVSRAGLSLASNLGLPELAAFSEDDYVGIATQLAHDLPRLAELRRTLRSQMEVSPLMDAPRFARNIETAYRTMWQRWCTETRSSSR